MVQMLLNVEKCKVMHLWYNNPKVNYVMDATQLQVVSKEKELEITVSDEVGKQCTTAVKQANKILGIIKRNFADKSKIQY